MECIQNVVEHHNDCLKRLNNYDFNMNMVTHDKNFIFYDNINYYAYCSLMPIILKLCCHNGCMSKAYS